MCLMLDSSLCCPMSNFGIHHSNNNNNYSIRRRRITKKKKEKTHGSFSVPIRIDCVLFGKKNGKQRRRKSEIPITVMVPCIISSRQMAKERISHFFWFFFCFFGKRWRPRKKSNQKKKIETKIPLFFSFLLSVVLFLSLWVHDLLIYVHWYN